MTINIANNNPRINYTATANQTVFTVPFEFFDNTDIKVYIEGTLKTITTHYTVSGGNGSTGTVTMSAGVTLNDEVTLVRDVPLERTTDLTSSYNAASIDAQLDRIVAEIADLDDRVSRTIQINDYELASGLLLPALDSRKGKTIQFNTSSGALEVGPTGADLTAIGSVTSEIATLAGISGNITTVAGSNAQVVAVGNAMTSITAVNSALTNINTVAGGIANINLVGGSIADVNDVADSLGEISAVQAKLTNIDTVAVASTNIGTVAGSITQVNNVAFKITDVTGVNNNISAITTANANATNINAVANNIDDVNDVGTVITKVTTVSDNIANVNLVAPNAQYLSDVANNITAINAIAPLADDLTNVTDNLTAIQNAGTNATNAANSATSAATSATAAQTAKTAAETALDEFTDIYLGSKSTAPTVDNDGNALATGSIYWNSGVDQLYIWTGSAWDDAAFTASGAVTSFNTRTGAVTLSSADVTNASGLLTTGGTMTGNLSFGDNDKAIFGAGSDLEIYHDGSASYIEEKGTGSLYIKGTQLRMQATDGTTYLEANDGGALTLKHDGATKFETTSTGIDVTGTVNADGLNIQNGSNAGITFDVSTNYSPVIKGSQSVSDLYLEAVGGGGFRVSTTDKPRLFIQNNGDISFYEDTGTTAKFFWDASAERLGLGTSSPSAKLHLKQSDGTPSTGLKIVRHNNDNQYLSLWANGGARYFDAVGDSSVSSVNIFRSSIDSGSNFTETMRIDSSGNVSIGSGTASTYVQLTVNGASTSNYGPMIELQSAGTAFGKITNYGRVQGGTSTDMFVTTATTNNLILGTNNAERMRIDSSGNVLVGKTTGAFATVGTKIQSNGQTEITAYNGGSLYLNRTSSDGLIAGFYKDSTAVGSIGVDQYDNYTVSSNRELIISTDRTVSRSYVLGDGGSSNGIFYPTTDNDADFGSSSKRWKDLYLSGGVYLGGTGSANKLDDFEEGTCTLTWSGTGGTANTTNNMSYVKVGSRVTISGNTSSATPNATGTLELTGLPFASNEDAVGALLYRYMSPPSNAHNLVMFIGSGETKLQPYWASGSDYTRLTSSQFAQSSAQDIYFSITYQTNA